MKTLNVGWEVPSLNNNGANFVVPILAALTIQKIQVDVSMMFPQGGSGPAEMLTGGWLQSSLVFGGASHEFPWGQPPWSSTEFGPGQLNNPNNIAGAGGASGGAGGLFTFILKTEAPETTDRQCVIENIGISATPGQYLVFHMDHAGVPADGEMQSVIYYTVP